MRHTIRFIILIFALVIAGAGNAWAISESDIIINVQPNKDAGTVTVTNISGMTVTISAVPATGYNIDANHIIAEKMVDAMAPRRAPGMSSPLPISGTNPFSFTIPEGYTGAYVTVNFYQDAPAGFTQITDLSDITDMNGKYQLTADVSGVSTSLGEFKGTLDGGLHKIIGSSKPLFASTDGAIIRNIIFEDVNISVSGDAGAVTASAGGNTRIYNCGILPSSTERDNDGNITGFYGSSVSGTGNVGGLVGTLSGNARVINCYSYANVSGGTNAAGIVGNNTVATTQSNLQTMVMNCMFYGNITGASTMKPVYGGQVISNAGASGINNYNYYRNGEDVTFDDDYENFAAYFCTLPADEEYLTRFEYYRSILNSNKKLCTWWISGSSGTAPTDAEVETVGIAKWVLDPEIAPYPILKKWGYYPSVINQDPEYVWNPMTKQKVSRAAAEPYQGKRLGTISVTVNAGAKHAGTGNTSVTLPSVIVMDMDTLNHDYGYAKIQLPYYNEVFGDPTVQIPATDAADYTTKWNNRYGGNYKEYVVTGWKITGVSGGTEGSFKGYAVTSVPTATSSVSAGTVTPDEISATAWEDGFNFADRNCTNKDKYAKSGRVFAQGGYYYVPEGVTAITIEAYWGKAVYLHNSGHSLDRVNVAAKESKDGSGGADNTGPDFGSPFTPAGTLATTFQTYEVKTNLQEAIAALTSNASYTVYDQAIVLVGNVQVKNRGGSLSSGSRPFTIMSCDLDMDNEPDYCLQFQQRNKVNRPPINPVRFDFLPVPELGLAIRTNIFAYTIGLMVPKGHFEITETSFMHTTQFEYDYDSSDRSEAPLILNGGHFEQIVVRKGPKNRTSYILMGGHFRMKRFTPGWHATPQDNNPIRHCAVNAIGGEYPEFYLSGIYAPDKATSEDNPHCYTNGGYFGLMAGAGYEQVRGDVTFKIDHSIIGEFYGGGINAAKPVTGKIDVTINNSLVGKYCGGPKVGVMSTVDGKLKTVTTNATGTTFGVFYGGGNGGTSYYREKLYDNTREFPTTDNDWKKASGNYTPKFNEFTPLNQENVDAAYKNSETENWGYHAEYEFEVFNASNGLQTSDDVIRLYYHWAQFGTTITGNVTNTLTNCTVTGNFFGGGNLATVTGDVTSTLKGNTHICGSAFAGGFSASIPSFPVHNKSTVVFPKKDKAGNVAEQGSLKYYQDGGKDRMYTWCYKNASGKVFPEGVVIPDGYNAGVKQKSVFKYPDTEDGKWYVLTTESLEGLGAVSGNTSLTIDENCMVEGNVYGGGDASMVDGNSQMTIYKGTVMNDVYGGGNVANVGGDTKLLLLGGTVNGDVYGGGKGRLEYGKVGDDNYVSPVAASVGATKVNLNGMEPTDYVEATHSALVEVYPEKATGDNIQYYTLKKKDANNKPIKGCVVKGNIFGCNNLNGTPTGSVTVNIYKTEGYDGHMRTGYNAETEAAREASLDDIDDSHHSYEVKAVYGGGNLAAYEPTDAANTHTQVNIYGCGDTSIQQVYGGGNAASTPATQVDVYGTYEIEELFGGGNGKDDISKDGGKTYIKNPGANVGFRDYWDYVNEKDKEEYDTKEERAAATELIYGTGAANVNIHGGRTHRVYGGSNTKGNVKTVAVTMLEDATGCDFNVDEAYGGGKSAQMDGASRLEMACIPGLKNAYGGAEAANIESDVTLTITNGNFNRVFGGNNISGTIHGKITVNIEETGCHLITIGQLYGGGNQAAYTGPAILDSQDQPTGKRQGPTLNVKSFTSIGEIYGGGYGKTATVTGDTYVNINVCDGKDFGTTEVSRANQHTGDQLISFSEYRRTNDGGFEEDSDGNRIVDNQNIHVYLPPYTSGIGGIGNVYGGGNAAKVDGSTHVNIGTVSGEITFETPTGETEENRKHEVKGANIVGNVYGGGNAAEVTGNTNVTIGKETTTTTPAPPVTLDPAPTTNP